MTKTVQITCPECGGVEVRQEECGGFGWCRCLNPDCRHLWDAELQEQERHKRRKEHEEMPLVEA